MRPRVTSYDALRAAIRQEEPVQVNMAIQTCADWALRDPDRVAIIDLSDGLRQDVTYAALQELAWRVQAALRQRGVRRGDCVGVLLGQTPLCAAAHIAAWAMGAISVPLFKLFRHDALSSRLEDSGCQVVVSDAEGADMLRGFDVTVIQKDGLGLPLSIQSPSGDENRSPLILPLKCSGTD